MLLFGCGPAGNGRMPSPRGPINTALQQDRKSTQRERLLSGMRNVAAGQGYAAANVSKVIAHAGVSRPTFYDYFADKDDCFLAAIADSQRRLLADIRQAVHSQAPERAASATIQALTGFASSEPAIARLLMNETMAGGHLAMDARDAGIAEIGRVIEDAYDQVSPATAIPDLSSRMMIGAIYRLIAPRLRRGEPGLSGLLGDLLGWLGSYEQPAGEHRWRALQPAPPPALSPALRDSPMLPPPPLPPGRPRLSKEEVAHNHRQRILFAIAQVTDEKSYGATTVADITKVAGVDQRAFYRLFADKQQAFAAAHELYFQHIMAATARAFFTGANWPERVWEAARGLTQSVEQTPTLAHLGLVEVHAAGPAAVQRLEDSIIAFTLFLQEGYQYASPIPPPSGLALEAIAATSFEIAYHQIRQSRARELTGWLPHLTHLSLAPFLGPAEANRFLDEKM